jgi:hypothetical protein
MTTLSPPQTGSASDAAAAYAQVHYGEFLLDEGGGEPALGARVAAREELLGENSRGFAGLFSHASHWRDLPSPHFIDDQKSEGRGAGTPMTCGEDEDKDGALCYPKCRPGFGGVGPVCWKASPEGVHDDGVTCRRDAVIQNKVSYSRGAGKPMTCGTDEE